MALALLVAVLTLNINSISNANAVLKTFTVNAAFNKTVIAKKTCGSPSEKYYDISQTEVKPKDRVPRVCDASNPAKAHNASNLVDNNFETFWQSTSMVNRANITIDFTGSLHKFYYVDGVQIWFQEFYRPLQMGLYKSTDNGVTYKPWHFYVSSDIKEKSLEQQCKENFNMKYSISGLPATQNAVICVKYPNETAKRSNDIVSWNPSSGRGEDVNPSSTLVEWINVTNIRIDFLTLMKPIDPLSAQWYHYAVKEVVIEAYCPCNGHAVGCKYSNTAHDNMCICQPGTCGEKCEMCCDAYNQYPWKHGGKGPLVVDESAACQLCNCHNHSSVCVYNETVASMNASMAMDGNYSGGGVCQNCQHNTTGINCEQCKKFFYHPVNISRTAINTCKECGCFADGCNTTADGEVNLDCTRIATRDNKVPVGSCYCKKNVMGRICNICKPGFYNLTKYNPVGCQVCRCDTSGSVNRSNICEPDESGQCPCKPNVHGIRCDTCNDTYYGLTHDDPSGCKACLCDKGGAKDDVCNKNNGQCICWKNIEGRQCTRPINGAYFPTLHVLSSDQESTESPWLSSLVINRGISTNSGVFILLMFYQSTYAQTVNATISWSNYTLAESIPLGNCSQTCVRNLTEFGEVPLSNVVTLNVMYGGDFKGVKFVSLPKEFYEPKSLGNTTVVDFLSRCSLTSTDFMGATYSVEYCKKQVFSITAGYFGKALECNCSTVGSYNLTCEKYGGQCACKKGVTGRQCDRCLPGFYNFTSDGCTACGCTTDDKVCNTENGQCNCPPNTIGRMCDKCNTTFWGWNSTTGCKACNCDMTGSSDLQCNLTTGICSCKKGVHLAKCTECKDDYKNFTSDGCSICNCDTKGSLRSVCNKTTGQCPCKTNSMSLLCNRCKPGTFHLYQPNPKGCTDCNCMGITSNCTSTSKYIYQHPLESILWQLYDEDTKKTIAVEQSVMRLSQQDAAFITANVSTKSQNLIWQAGENLTQLSLVSSYAGNLSFALHVSNMSTGVPFNRPKVTIKGSHNIAIEQYFESVDIDQVTTRAVFMKESSWVYNHTNTTVSREHFMLVLAKPLAIQVTASLLTHGDGFYMTSFGGVKVSAVQNDVTVQGKALEVEQCNCGPEYTGLSCERCAASHHRVNVSGDPFFGKCQRCICYKHSLDCYSSTGHCYNCDHNTTGSHCERCLDGFYGNATDGTPSDCKTCPCEAPRTTTSLCTDFYGQPKCTNCSVGYEGQLCDKCQLKYFGKPHLPGGNCSLCQCNNNSDICNTISGECMECKHNTTGFYCERCENGTYGYAPVQNCTGCGCNSTGSKNNVCNHRNGQCECHPNIDTRDCSKCVENSYNFTSSGCTQCNCNKHGSVQLQCNESGICTCKPHALGKKCDRCETNFYGLPFSECKMCNCSTIGSNTSVPCNGVTGQCHCKPGVTGRQCDQCMVMHYNFSSSGCTPCDECTRIALRGKLNDTQKNIIASLDKATQVKKLRPFKEELQKVEDRITATENLIKEFDKRIQDLQNGLVLLKNNTLNSSIHNLRAQLSLLSTNVDRLRENTTKTLNRVQEIKNKTEVTSKLIQDVKKLASSVNGELKGLQTSASDMLSKANATLQNSYSQETTKANNELTRARNLQDKLAYARGNVTEHKTRVDALDTSITRSKKSLNGKMFEFGSLSQRSSVVDRLSGEVNIFVEDILVLITQSNKTLAESRGTLQRTRSLITLTWEDVNGGHANYKNTENVLGGNLGLLSNLATLNSSIPKTQTLIHSTNTSVYINATLHAANLTAEANIRKSELDSVQDNARRAVAAIKQYEESVKLVNQSLETTVKVNQSLQEIMNVLNNMTPTFSDMKKRAEDSLKTSQKVLNTTKTRRTDIMGLQKNLSSTNQTFNSVTYVGRQVDQYHLILVSRFMQLIALSEPHAQEHSVFKHTRSAESYGEQVNRKWSSILANGNAVQQESKRLNASMATINLQAERARVLMPESFQLVSRVIVLQQNVTKSANLAHTEKNKTTELQLQLAKNMETLKAKLKMAKERIAKIQHALRVQGNTSLQYSPIGRMASKTAFTEVSLDLKADIIQGPLLYLAEGSTHLDNQVSISLVLVHGEFVKFSYNLGSGPISIINYEVPVRRGSWYRVYASRLQYTARLTVTSFATNISKTYESLSNLILPYETTNFTADSPMFVGSLPDGAMTNESHRFFYGCIDNVVINQEGLNLWQPLKVTGDRYACSKCLESASIPRHYDIIPGTSFFGNPDSHVIQSMGTFDISEESQIIFQFRTFLENASIVNVQGNREYLYGIYISNGQVVFYFKNDSDIYRLQSTRNSTYNNGRWYQIYVIRGLINSSLTIKDVASEEKHTVNLTLDSVLTLKPGMKLVFGGKNPQSSFPAPVNKQFAGAIRNVSLSSNGGMVPRILNSNSSMEGSSQVDFCGVLHHVEPCIRFRGNSFAAMETEFRNMTKLSFKFKTLQPSGILVYGFETSMNYYFYLTLFHGNLYLIATNTPKTTGASFTKGETLNQGDYHTLNIEVVQNRLKVFLDTRSTPIFNILASGPIQINGTLYVGALPSSIKVPFDIPVIEPFVGGMRDIKFNDRNQDIFSGTADKVSLAGCPPEINIVPTAKPTIPPPTQPPPTCGDRYPGLQLSTAKEQARLGPSNAYIGFNLTRKIFDYMKQQHVITINFRSLSPNGVLLYTADNMHSPSQFLLVEIVNGRLIYKFKTGTKPVRIQSSFKIYGTYGRWYEANFLRIGGFGGLLVSADRDYSNNKTEEDKQPLILNSPFYYGGVPKGINASWIEARDKNGEAISFYGCLGTLTISSANKTQVESLNPRKDSSPEYSLKGNASCYKTAGPQASFNGRSYIKVYENYLLSNRLDLTLSFRTYIRTGLLLVWTNKTGKGAITLEQLHGQIILTLTSETNQTSFRWTDPDIPRQGQYNASYKLCDNNFHKVRFQRENSMMMISVDSHSPERFSIEDGFYLDGDFYVGGVPDGTGIPSHTGLSKRRLEGCVQGLIVNLKYVDLIREAADQKDIQPVCRTKAI